MLDSLVRVSRRVGGTADLLATETPSAPARALAIRDGSCTRRPRRQEPGACRTARGSTSKLRPGPRSAASGSSREPPEKCSPRRGRRSAASSRIADAADGRGRWPESPAATSRVPPFTAAQFHVLLNSLFKVLFNFPSRYLFAIGLGVIFSLTWSLPRTLSCTPKQLDSRGKPAQRSSRLTGLSPSTGRGPSQGGL